MQQIEITEPFYKRTLLFPRERVLAVCPRLGDLDALPSLAGSAPARLLVRFMNALAAELPDLDAAAGAAAANAALELLRAAVEPALPSDRSATRAAMRAEVARYVRSHLRDPDLGPATIARAYAMSVRTLHALFEDVDESVAALVRAERLARCLEDLRRANGGSVTVLGLGPIGDMATRIASHLGYRVIAVDRVAERLARAVSRGVEVLNLDEHQAGSELGDAIRAMTDGRGTDAVIDAVGMEAHGSPLAKVAQQVTGLLPDAIAKPMMEKVGVDRLDAFYSAIDIVRRGGTISLIGVYGGMADPLPMLTLFDKQIQLRMGQANVKKWVDDIMPLLTDDDPLGVDTFATHTLPLGQAPRGYDIFQKKQDGAVKVILKPGSADTRNRN